MSEGKYLKGSCSECGTHIEFPEAGLGQVINCPHCGLKTKLGVHAPSAPIPASPPTATPTAKPVPRTSPAEVEADEPAGASRGLLVGLLVLVLAGAAGGGLWWKSHAGHASASAEAAPPKAASTVGEAATNTETVAEPAAPKAPKAAADLKLGAIRLEQTKGSSLVYAVGVVNNESDYQRFGVRIELNLINAKGERVGGAQDYIAVIEPRKTWEFRVLVNDPKAVAATLSALREE